MRDGRIYTPAIDSGLLPGTVREYICESEAVTQTVIFPDELSSYQECFVTNSLMGVMPVKLLGNISFEERNVTAMIMRKYHNFQLYAGKMPFCIIVVRAQPLRIW